MGTLFESFEILCTDYDYILGKRGDSIQGRTLYKGGHYSRKYGSCFQDVMICRYLKGKNRHLPGEYLAPWMGPNLVPAGIGALVHIPVTPSSLENLELVSLRDKLIGSEASALLNVPRDSHS